MTRTRPYPFLTRLAFILLWLFVFSLPLTLAPEIPFAGLISKVIGAATLATGMIAVASRRQIRLLEPIHLVMAGFILWSAVTLCWSIAPHLTVARTMSCLQLFMGVLLIWEFCVEEREVLQILGAFVLGTLLPALSTLYAFLPGQQTLFQRAATPGFDPNTLAFLLAISVPVAYYLILREKRPVAMLYRLQMGFAACAVLLSGSAAILIAMAVGLSLVCWTIHIIPAHTRNRAFGLIVVIGTVVLMFTPTTLWQRVSQESHNGGIALIRTIDYRLQNLTSAPIAGLGAGALAPEGTHSLLAGNSFIMLSETGIVGVACFITLVGVLFLTAERLSGVTKSFWFTVLGVWSVGVCTLDWESVQPAWLLFGLLAAHAASLRQEGVTEVEREKKRNYYVEQGAEVWS